MKRLTQFGRFFVGEATTAMKLEIIALFCLSVLCGLYVIWSSQTSFIVVLDTSNKGNFPFILTKRESKEEVEPRQMQSDFAESLNKLDEDEEIIRKNSWLSWEKEQSRRKEVIRNACKRLNISQNFPVGSIQIKDYFRQFLVDDNHKALYCSIPKVASTNWKRVWMALTGMTTEKNLTSIPVSIPHEKTADMELLQSSSKYEDIETKIKSYKKLIVVRHPFHRLLSAYRDKIHYRLGKPFFQMRVFAYIRMFRTSVNMTNIQWSEFVDFLNAKGGDKGDNHWRSSESMCHPCAIQYDVIAKYETLWEDSEKFLRLIDAPEDLHFPNTSRTARRVDKEFWMDYQKQLSRKQLTMLYKKYGKDFKIFGYDKKT